MNKQTDPHMLAKKYFGLTLPTTLDALKSAFRSQCKILHTDTSGRDTKADFIEMKKAYDRLIHMTRLVSANGDYALEKKTVDGTPLSELGLGLGPTKNGKDCPSCQRKGYVRRFGKSWTVCDACDTMGGVPREFECRSCKGTGRFVQRTSKREVPCRTCKGTGRFKHPRLRILCKQCGGTKTVYSPNNTEYFEKCWNCKGTGELLIFNPVLPKGAII